MDRAAWWIWQKKEAANHSECMLFRKTVTYDRLPPRAEITVTADSCFILFINGQQILRGPTKSDLSIRYTDTVDLAPYLRIGENVLAAEVIHYPGDRHLANDFKAGPTGQTSSAQGGLLICGDADWQTDTTYRCLPAAFYSFTPLNDTELMYLGHFESVNGALYPVGWQEPGYADGEWQQAAAVAENVPYILGGLANVWQIEPDPIPRPYEKAVSMERVTRCAPEIAAQAKALLTGDWLELPARASAWLELDAGEYRTAFPEWEIQGGRGAVIRFLYAESYGYTQNGEYVKGKRDDFRHPGSYLKGGEDVFLADGREQRYTPFHYRAFRFIRLEATGGETALRIRLKAVRQTGYPLDVRSAFHCRTGPMEQIWAVSLRTLKNCMYDTYMDCPYYERMQYLLDTRLEALYGYAVSWDDRLARKALRDFYNAQLPNGLMPCHSPANILQIIPSFTFYWIMMLADHYAYFGDKKLIDDFFPGVEKALAYFVSRLDERKLLADTGFWQFVDWTDAWERGVPVKEPQEVNTIYTLMLVHALRLSAELAEVTGRNGCRDTYRRLSEEIAAAVNTYAFDEEAGLYTDTVGRRQWSQHAQIWAVLSGTAGGRRAETVMWAAMQNRTVSQCSFCMQFFLFRALEKAGLYEESRAQWKLWERMLSLGVTTWPEDPVTWRSDCHAWSAVPLQELMTRGVGIRPAEPGFARVHIAPRMYWLGACAGSYVTPHGRVAVAWKLRDGELTVTAEAEQPTPVRWELTDGQVQEEVITGRVCRSVLLEPGAAAVKAD